MALIDLDAETMIAVTDSWVDPQKDRPRLMSYPPVAGVLPTVENAQTELIDTQKVAGQVADQVVVLTHEIADLDRRHDRLARGTYRILNGASDLADDDERREELLNLRDLFFPKGLKVITSTYLTQAGNVRMVEKRMTSEVRDKLATLEVDGRRLDEVVDEWIEVGSELGAVFTERSRLRRQEDPDAVSAGDVHRARMNWIAAVNAFLSVLDLADIDDDEKEELLMPLRDAERTAARSDSRSDVDEIDEIDDVDEMDDLDEDDDTDDVDEPVEPIEPVADDV